MVITFETTVHDGSVALLRNAFLGHLLVDPVGVSPHVRADLAKLNVRRGVLLHSLLEGLIEVTIVEEDIRIVIPAVEVALHRLHRLDHTIQFLVSGEDNEGSIGARLAGVGLKTAGNEDLVVLFADFSAPRG